MTKEKRIPRTYKLKEEVLYQVVDISEKEGITYTDVVEEAISGLYKQKYFEKPNRVDDDSVLRVFERQLEVKDQQIEALNDALRAAQESLKESQSLICRLMDERLERESE